nr:mannosylglycoprotein endo-beta-mannosidase [Quercus suber]
MCKRHCQGSIARDTVKLLRNHPSLALWVGENEQVPPDDINRAWKNDLRLHPYFENSNEISKSSDTLSAVSKDPSQYFDGTRVYIQGSLWDGFANIELHGTPKDLDDFYLESSVGGLDFPFLWLSLCCRTNPCPAESGYIFYRGGG